MASISALRAFANGEISTLTESAYESYRKTADTFYNLTLNESIDKANYIILEESYNCINVSLETVLNESVIGSIFGGIVKFFSKIIEVLKSILNKIKLFFQDLFSDNGSSSSKSSSEESKGSDTKAPTRDPSPNKPSSPNTPKPSSPSTPKPSAPSKPSSPKPNDQKPAEPTKKYATIRKWDTDFMEKSVDKFPAAAQKLYDENEFPPIGKLDKIREDMIKLFDEKARSRNIDPEKLDASDIFTQAESHYLHDNIKKHKYSTDDIEKSVSQTLMNAIFSVGNSGDWDRYKCKTYIEDHCCLDADPKEVELTSDFVGNMKQFVSRADRLQSGIMKAVSAEIDYCEYQKKMAITMEKDYDREKAAESEFVPMVKNTLGAMDAYAQGVSSDRLNAQAEKIGKTLSSIESKIISKYSKVVTKTTESAVKFFNTTQTCFINCIKDCVSDYRKAIVIANH